jgi:hypothetical protein
LVPYVKASKTHCVSRIATLLANEKASEAACHTLDLAEARRQKQHFKDMETCLMVLTQGITNHDMDYCEEESAIRHSSKKISNNHGATQPSYGAASSHAYTSPARINRFSNKRNQIYSPAAHYTALGRRNLSPANKSAIQLAAFFGPGGGAQQALTAAEAASTRLFSYT